MSFSVLLQLLTFLNFFFLQSHLWKFQPGLEAVPAVNTKFELDIPLCSCNTSCVYSDPVRVGKPISLSIIRRLLLYLSCRLLLGRVLLHIYNSTFKTCGTNLRFEEGVLRAKLGKFWDFHSNFRF